MVGFSVAHLQLFRARRNVTLMPDRHQSSPRGSAALVGCVVTALLVVSPVVAIAVSVPLLWGHAIHLRDVVLAAILYAVTGHGVTVGFHPERVSGGETPLAQTAVVVRGVSWGGLIHVVSGIRGALGGRRNRSGRAL